MDLILKSGAGEPQLERPIHSHVLFCSDPRITVIHTDEELQTETVSFFPAFSDSSRILK